MKKNSVDMSVSNQQLERELKRTATKRKRWLKFRRSIAAMLVLAAILVLLTVFWLPVYHITGNSMEPTLEQGQIVVALHTRKINPGDVVALYFDNQILIKRVIGISGDRIHLDEQGTVSVNDELLDEEYLSKPVTGSTDLTYPYLVPEGHYFVIGDNREKSIDSRMSQFGCVVDEKIAGKIIFRVWPLNRIGYIG